MEYTSNNSINAVEMLADQIVNLIKTHEHKYDRTFASAVKSINNDSTYTIMDDEGVNRNVGCTIPNAVLRIGQYVWVKVPSGRLEDMHICGIKQTGKLK